MNARAKASMASCDRVLEKCAWLAAMEEGWDASSLQVDCSCFRFQDGFDKDAQYRFFQYAKTLDMTQLRAVAKLYIWLAQNGVKFAFGFRWNRRLPVWHNLKQYIAVKKMQRMVQRWSAEDVMSYDLAKCPYALHP